MPAFDVSFLRWVISGLPGLLCIAGLSSVHSAAAQDARSFQHGVDLLALPNGHYKLIWSSSGNPPTGADDSGDWPHDVYSCDIDPANPQIVATTLISRPEAQEPASSAIADDGNIMVTMEDGWNADNVLVQRYGVYDMNLDPVRGYPQTVFDGGHSGHVAAVGNRFVVFYSEGWVEGGGVDDLGSGDDVYLSAYHSSGKHSDSERVAVGNATRDWWPLVAGSKEHAMLLWQRFVDNKTHSELFYTIYHPGSGSFVKTETRLAAGIEYYTYDIQYVESIDRFLVVAAYEHGGGFAVILSDDGKVIAEQHGLPEVVREAQPAISVEEGSSPASARVVYPKSDGGVMLLDVTSDTITLKSEIAGPRWQTAGADGIFTDSEHVYFVNLTPDGLLERTFKLAR